MASQYTDFLRSPSTALLAPDASLVYITTTIEIREANAIIKHLQAQQKQVDKKQEKILNSISGQNGLCLETETTLLFREGGGAYLPIIEANQIDEKLATFPLTHIVRFDDDGKIKQIRLSWDMGTVLKQVDVIGRTGRNWPIKDGRAQVEAINKTLKAGGSNTDVSSNGTSAGAPRGQHDVVINQHRKRSSVSATRDPHASLALFQPRDPNEDTGPRQFEGPKTSPRESYKAPPRGLDEILASDDSQQAGSQIRSSSPTKIDGLAPKAGAGRHHVNNRLFDENEASGATRSPERKKTFQNKSDHFEFGDGEDVPDKSRPISSRGGGKSNPTQIDFAAFSVSPSVKGKGRPDHEKHWGSGVQEDDPPSPAKRPVVHAPRPDADAHFQFADGSPVPGKAKSLQRQKGMGIYQDPTYDDERTGVQQNSKSRGNDVDAHFSMADSSPAAGVGGKTGRVNDNANANANAKASDGARARNDMDAHWEFGTPVQEKKIYKTAGNGMGGRRDAARGWGIGQVLEDDSSGSKRKRGLGFHSTVGIYEDGDEGGPREGTCVDEEKGGFGGKRDSVVIFRGSGEDGTGAGSGTSAGVDGALGEMSGNAVKKQKMTKQFNKDMGEAVEPDTVLSDDDAVAWSLLRKSRGKGVTKA